MFSFHIKFLRLMFRMNKKRHADKAQCVKNKVQTLLFCLYKGTSLFIPKTFLLKKQKQNSFLMTICTDRSNEERKKRYRGQTKGEAKERERQNVKGDKRYQRQINKDSIKYSAKEQRYDGQTGQDVGGLDMEGKGDTQLCGFYS